MQKRYIIGFVLFVIIVGVFTILDKYTVSNEIEGNTELIVVDSLRPGEYVSSPVTVTGRARGYWFFEADFPVHLLDENKNEITVAVASAEGEWMTEDFVPFTVTLEFDEPKSETGYIRLEKDNPSGLPEHDDYQLFPVSFLR
jgi:hypothetical protein